MSSTAINQVSELLGETGTPDTPHHPAPALQDTTPPGDGDDDDTSSHAESVFSLPEKPPKAKALTARRIFDNARFDDWQRDQRRQVYGPLSNSAIRDESKSAAWLVREAEREKIIASPREYQTELFERAKSKNIIAVLDTGTGKTLIAALLLRHTIAQELEDRDAGQPPRMSFFLVDKVALVFQQYEVLKANLDHPVEKFTGASGTSTLTPELWNQQFEKKMVIVCTPEILYHCLHHAFVKMEQINLLIFDEAHHAKKNHPYARIVKDFYAALETRDGRRPRILGMTASPVDAKTDVTTAAAQLEGLLHCEIATVDDTTVYEKSSINKPKEDMIEYSKMTTPFETLLWKKLYGLVGHNEAFARMFTYAKECTTELGRWCADRVWQLCLTYEEALKIEARTERDFNYTKSLRPMSELDAERSAVREAYQLVLDHQFVDVENHAFHVSDKVASLIRTLEKNFDPDTDKCIVFVEQRLPVRLLTDLFKQRTLGIFGLRSGMLIGAASSVSGDMGMSMKEQVLTMHQFRHGDLNIIFATSIGEEGIDIPDCNMIIRFDLCKTMIQYIQSRGRARQKNSKFFQMIEFANHSHVQSVFENRDNEYRLRRFCATLAEDRLVAASDYDIDYFLSKEKTHRTYVVKATGAKLTYQISLVVLATFVSSLPHPADVSSSAEYIMRNIGGEYECEVLLPDSAPVKSAIGRRAPSKQVAKCSAAFEMCLKLKRKKHLDDYFQSTFTKRLPAMRNARLAISSKKRAGYPMRFKPDVWANRGIPEDLFVTVLRLSSPEAMDRSSKPMALLTRQPLPQVTGFPLFFGNKRTSGAHFIPLPRATKSSDELLDGLNQFTLRVFKDVFSKEYKSEPEKMPYFLAPLIHPHDFDYESITVDPHTIIDWQCISMVQNTPDDIDWENKPEEVFEDKFVRDPHDGSRKFYTLGRRRDLKPTDPQLPGLPKGQHKKKAHHQETPDDIWNFSVSLWSKSRTKITIRHDLPVVEAVYIPLRRNLLDEFDVADEVQRRCYLVFATLKLSSLPVDFVAMVYNLPAIIYRLDSNLIALETCKSLGLDIRPDLALEAMTKDSENTEEHAEEQVNLQHGMGANYERLEFLGDSFLKMSTTIALFSQIPDSDEFQYHVDRMVLICNQNLFNNALEMKLEESIRTKAFNRRLWYPDGLELLRGKQLTSNMGKKGAGSSDHVLADKSIADACEALIGASYMTTYQQNDFDMAIQAVTKFVNHKHHQMMKWSDYYLAYNIPEWQMAESTAVQKDLARQIEAQLGYKFNYPRLLRSAFMHPSYGTIYERIPSYQRLEFLGDALLDMVCVDFLYHRFPGADPQWLTEHKMAMVSNQFLGCLCVNLGFQKHMMSMTGGLQREITEYVVAITDARTKAEEEAESANLERTAYARNFWVNEKKPPKSLPDVVEAYIGAVFVDSEYDYGQVQGFFNRHIRSYFEDMHQYDTFANKHPVTFLTNRLSLHFHCRDWRLMISEVDDEENAFTDTQVLCGVMIHGEVREHAKSASGRYAKIKAAERTMSILKDMSVEEFKQKYSCNCTPNEVLAEGSDPLAHATAI
ncbi:Uu.00g022710.m01.CDS01 [Anthostomella pinea]|uniref:Dicer-like protein 1 n=1 Tax=Anthostomella pinea TaxID=933095 RepID=A0AAI8VZZ8_9PEZI|nr:Uu.00g022710.m01.CDS01 [Anthostomella pinea]